MGQALEFGQDPGFGDLEIGRDENLSEINLQAKNWSKVRRKGDYTRGLLK